MKKNSAKTSQKAFKRHVNNKKRKAKAEEQKDWHKIVNEVKFMQEYFKRIKEQSEATNPANEVKQ